ncbi:PREDICTED: 40S ribosomal protein S11, partial [Mesitornis unicolor]|uniref:40S ribosomal protein S11 n=1 Tax=Mesitornis unicolor TaxID=54374 RepID=UPI000528E54B
MGPQNPPNNGSRGPANAPVVVSRAVPPGVVTKMKMQRTIVIRRDYLHYIRKYNRFEKRHKNMSVHLSPCFRNQGSTPKQGDLGTTGVPGNQGVLGTRGVPQNRGTWEQGGYPKMGGPGNKG